MATHPLTRPCAASERRASAAAAQRGQSNWSNAQMARLRGISIHVQAHRSFFNEYFRAKFGVYSAKLYRTAAKHNSWGPERTQMDEGPVDPNLERPPDVQVLSMSLTGSYSALGRAVDVRLRAACGAKPPGGSGASAALLDAPIGALEGLLSNMRSRWGDPLSSSAIDPAAAAADDAATLARALAQLRAAQTRLAVTAD